MIENKITYICTLCKYAMEHKPVACPRCENDKFKKENKVITKGV
jgi:rubrerythrin